MLKRLIIKGTRLALAHLSKGDLPKAQIDIIRRFHVLVEMNFRDKHQVADYADMLFKSPKTLSNLFKQFNDKTPLQTINERIVLEAKRLMLNPEKTSKEIGYELGYTSANHFSKFFKKETGLSPQEYRLKIKAGK